MATWIVLTDGNLVDLDTGNEIEFRGNRSTPQMYLAELRLAVSERIILLHSTHDQAEIDAVFEAIATEVGARSLSQHIDIIKVVREER